MSASTSAACSDTGWASSSPFLDKLASGCDDALSTRKLIISRRVEGSSGRCADISEGGEVIRTSCVNARRNCRGDNDRGKT